MVDPIPMDVEGDSGITSEDITVSSEDVRAQILATKELRRAVRELTSVLRRVK